MESPLLKWCTRELMLASRKSMPLMGQKGLVNLTAVHRYYFDQNAGDLRAVPWEGYC